jgi:hypothetical protein
MRGGGEPVTLQSSDAAAHMSPPLTGASSTCMFASRACSVVNTLQRRIQRPFASNNSTAPTARVAH